VLAPPVLVSPVLASPVLALTVLGRASDEPKQTVRLTTKPGSGPHAIN